MHSTLITAETLHEAIKRSGVDRPLVFDCSFDLANTEAGAAQYHQAHIPGAVYAHLDRHLSNKAHPNGASAGRHPLPEREAFVAWLASVGLAQDQQVVVYDRQGAHYCGRLWWMLKWCGHEAVAVLDGGFGAWHAAGYSVESGEPLPPASFPDRPFTTGPSLATTVQASSMANQLGSPSQTVIDARAAPRFRGEVEPLDPVAGHIPGAINRPFTENFSPDGRFKPAAQLRREFDRLLAGRDPACVVHHCGSGVTATPNILAMELAGLGRAALFPGSWSEWSNTPGLPVARS
ncbi:sulfurtransferase [Hydrogenophaga sp. PAMC20947]|uniref:sulfurtransferase n=1 Tax=Hydrogenophaga sp. PAMC20947 TaxID=2565558 RepID=UPI00109DB48C|nr:sulfurtransferase [Hydrogenophaga sp. PAMC20947]QCB45918.1 sulfurtransferase [Hydrogenophaga sp. PAMC20947]